MMENKKRLIYADKIYDAVERRYQISSGDAKRDFLDLICASDTVDAVEVVRCKDCKWYKPGDLFTDIMFCHRLKKENGKPAKYNFCEDDFCSYGERKSNGES